MQKKNISLLFIAGFITLFLASCSTVSVTTDYDKSVDFTKYKTLEYYGWAKESDKILNDFDKRRIEEAFGDEFAKRGFKVVESGGDMVVSLFIVVEQKTEQRATTDYAPGMGGYYGGHYGYGPGWGWGSGYSTTTVSNYDYKVGTLVIDVFDKASEQLIWESIGQGTVDDNPQSRDKHIPKTVAKIMKDYPVQPIKE